MATLCAFIELGKIEVSCDLVENTKTNERFYRVSFVSHNDYNMEFAARMAVDLLRSALLTDPNAKIVKEMRRTVAEAQAEVKQQENN